jgi:hypothetical protein
MTEDANLPAHLDSIGRQLVAAAHAQNATAVSGHHQRALSVLALASVAVAAALAVIVLNNAGASRTVPPAVALVPHRPGNSHYTQPHPKLVPLAHPTAKQVLNRAAFVALQTSPVTPQPDQFVYTETQAGNGQITQSWLSVDGTRTSVIDQPGQASPTTIPGCAAGHRSSRTPGEDGRPLGDFLPASLRGKPILMSQAGKYFPGGRVPMDGPIVTTKCTPQVAFYPDMPTDPSLMQAYLVKIHQEYPPNDPEIADPLNDLAKNVGFMLDTDYLLPAQQAALYRFLATTPGITVKQPVEDVTGRAGIGVEWNFMGSSAMLIFDDSTYQYLGTSTIGEQGQVGGDALLQTAIVNTAGSQPTSTQPSTTSTSAAGSA